MWLSLIIATSYRPMRLLVPPPQRTAYFSRARSPGVVLRVSSTVRPVPARRVRPATGVGGDAGRPADEVEQGPLGDEDDPGGAGEHSEHVRRR